MKQRIRNHRWASNEWNMCAEWNQYYLRSPNASSMTARRKTVSAFFNSVLCDIHPQIKACSSLASFVLFFCLSLPRSRPCSFSFSMRRSQIFSFSLCTQYFSEWLHTHRECHWSNSEAARRVFIISIQCVCACCCIYKRIKCVYHTKWNEMYVLWAHIESYGSSSNNSSSTRGSSSNSGNREYKSLFDFQIQKPNFEANERAES